MRWLIAVAALAVACGGDPEEGEQEWSDEDIRNGPDGWENPYTATDVECGDVQDEQGRNIWSYWLAEVYLGTAQSGPHCIRFEDGFGGTSDYCAGQEEGQDVLRYACRHDGDDKVPCLWGVLMRKEDGQCINAVGCVPESRWFYPDDWRDWDAEYQYQCHELH